jgi:hypothetical protein
MQELKGTDRDKLAPIYYLLIIVGLCLRCHRKKRPVQVLNQIKSDFSFRLLDIHFFFCLYNHNQISACTKSPSATPSKDGL